MDENTRIGVEVAEKVGYRTWQTLKGYFELEELQAQAVCGMLEILPAWNPERGKLKTYLYPKVYFRLIDWVRSQSRLSRLEVRRVQQGLREPLKICSTENLVPGTEDTIGENLEAEPIPYYQDDIDDILHYVSGVDRQILELYYLQDLTMKQAAAIIGLSESRVSQRHKQILIRLRGIYEVRKMPEVQQGLPLVQCGEGSVQSNDGSGTSSSLPVLVSDVRG